MHGVAFLLVAAALAHLVARRLRLPALPFLLLGGVVVNRVAHLPAESVEDTLVLGLTFLLFLDGMELDPRRVAAQGRAALRVGILQFAVLAGVGFAAAGGLGFSTVEAGYLALALAASSTVVCVRLLQQRRQMFEPFGRLVLGVLLVQDVAVLLAIPLVTGAWDGLPAAGLGVLAVAALGALAVAVRRWVAPLFLRLADEPEELMLLAFALLFAFLALGEVLELPPLVGAFLAGVALARFPTHRVVWSVMAPVGDFFSATFFTALGAILLLPTPTQLAQALALAVLLLVTTVPLVAYLAERSGLSARSALEAGLLLSQTSEISLVVVLSGMLAGDVGVGTFTVFGVVTVVTMLWTPFLGSDRVAWSLVRRHPFRPRHAREPATRNHVLLVGAGSAGMPLVEDLLIAGVETVVVDDDPAVLGRLAEAGLLTVRGDAADPRVVRRAGASAARVVSSTLPRPRDNEALLEEARGVPVLVRVFDEEDARWVRARGGTPFLYSAATADVLMEWFRERRDELEDQLAERLSGARAG